MKPKIFKKLFEMERDELVHYTRNHLNTVSAFIKEKDTAENWWWLRIHGTVIGAVWWKVLFVVVFTFSVLIIDRFILSLKYPQTLIPILSVVVGLLLGFRTNNAYDRYYEARKVWAKMTHDIRKLTRCIWLGVEEPTPKSITEKKSAVNLLIGFMVATKHYLREEYGDKYTDIKRLIAHLPRFKPPPPPIATEDTLKADYDKKIIHGAHLRLKAYECNTPTNIPLEISYYLLTYIKYVTQHELAASWAVSGMHHGLDSLVDSLCTFERILRTPIPMAYSMHLHISVWLYILALPFQIIGSTGWMSLLVMGLGSFCILGIMAVAYEIENPFGYDDNDLPLDDYCEVMRAEIDTIIGTQIPSAEDWIYSDDNRPYFPVSKVNAQGFSWKKLELIQEILAKSKSRCLAQCSNADEKELKTHDLKKD